MTRVLTKCRLSPDGEYKSITPHISVRVMPISHGQPEGLGTYECTAFFVRHNRSHHEFLFFGDVEPDRISANPRNRYIWRAAAHKIPDTLSAIFIECSYPSGRQDDLLYGHLSPEHLLEELTCLAVEVVNSRTRAHRDRAQLAGSSSPARKKQRRDSAPPPSPRGALEGLRVYIIHCKDDIHGIYDRPINHVVADEVRTLVDARGLGATIIAVDQGMQIGASTDFLSGPCMVTDGWQQLSKVQLLDPSSRFSSIMICCIFVSFC